jgi:pyridine nucleotide-disulfide oxidoreductase family protein
MKDLVLVGGGHSHVAVLRHFGESPMADVRITLISRGDDTPYSGMLPGLIAGQYSYGDAHIDLRRLAGFASAQTVFAEATGLDLAKRVVHCADGRTVPYDLVSLNIGSTPNASVPGAEEHAIAVKPIDRFLPKWDALCERTLASAAGRTIAVVGGGAGGVELLLSAQFRLRMLVAARGRSADRLAFHLFTSTDTILPTHNARARAAFERILAQRGVAVHTANEIVRVERGRLHTVDGAAHLVDDMLWTTEARAASWLRESGLAVDRSGFVSVSPTLQSVSHADVFAAGDVASIAGTSLEKSGVYAVREGEALAPNLRRALMDEPLRPYKPQRQVLSLISTGDRYAVGSRGPFALEGRWVWRWKDAIDRRFMRRYKALLAVVVLLAAGCVTAGPWPRTLAIGDIRAQPTVRGEWIASDEEALASIAAIMSRDLGLPPVRAELQFHRDRDAFRDALVRTGYEPAFAQQTAQTLVAVSGFRRVFINDAALQDLPMPYRIALLAHELTHTIQYEWGGGTRGTSDQWLREGFAEWVEVEALIALGFTTRQQARATILRRLRQAGVARTLPPLSAMVTFPEWVSLAQKFGEEPIYGYAGIATELLLERHGLAKTIAYFEMFARSSDRLGNFRQAFGEDVQAFADSFRVHLATLLR